jgi:hypothetical protein
MAFDVKDLMIHVLPEETWQACTCSVGTNQCGQCTDFTGDDLEGGDDEEEQESSYSAAASRTGSRSPRRIAELAEIQAQLREALRRPEA